MGLVLLEIKPPDRSSLDILRHIRSSYLSTPVLIMTGFSEAQYAVLALKAGAPGFLRKDWPRAEWMEKGCDDANRITGCARTPTLRHTKGTAGLNDTGFLRRAISSHSRSPPDVRLIIKAMDS